MTCNQAEDINHFLIRNKYNINNLEIQKLMNRDVKDINIEKVFGGTVWGTFWTLHSDLGFIQALYIEHLPFLLVIYFHIDILECRFKAILHKSCILHPV